MAWPGVKFGEKHSFNDWGLTLRERPSVETPKQKTIYIDIPGSNGSLDMSEALTGYPTYERRQLRFSFNIMGKRKFWNGIIADVRNYMHGKEMKIILDEDCDYYYMGRVSVTDESNSDEGIIVVEALADAYKYEMLSSEESWEWDTFNFETGIIREYKDIDIFATEMVINVVGSRMPVVPEIVCKDRGGLMCTAVYINGVMKMLKEGSNRFPEIILKEGMNELKFIGIGIVDIAYRGGWL